MSLTLIAATEVSGLIIGIGGASVVLRNGVRSMRRFWRFVDRQEAVPGQLEELKAQVADLADAVKQQGEILVKHVDGDAPDWLAEGRAWGSRLEEAITAHDKRLTALEGRTG